MPRSLGYNVKMNEGKVRDARARFNDGEKIKDLAIEYGVSRKNMSDIVNERTWRWVV